MPGPKFCCDVHRARHAPAFVHFSSDFTVYIPPCVDPNHPEPPAGDARLNDHGYLWQLMSPDELADEVMTLRAQVKVLQNWVAEAKRLGLERERELTEEIEVAAWKIRTQELALNRAKSLGYDPDTRDRPGAGHGGLA